MILAGVLLKLGSYGLIVVLPLVDGTLLYVYLYITLVGSVVCCCACARHWDCKGLIAYSSVVHIGVVTVGLLSGRELGYFCALLIIVGHAVCSPILFLYASRLYASTHTRLLSQNRGNIANPMSSTFCFVFLAVNMGVPPFVGFWSEVSIFTVLASVFLWGLLCSCMAVFGSALYNLFIYVSLVHGKESPGTQLTLIPWRYIRSLLLSFLLATNMALFA